MHWIDSNKMNGYWAESIFISCGKLINRKPKNTSEIFFSKLSLIRGIQICVDDS